VRNVVDGTNMNIFSYGQQGSGKTDTLHGNKFTRGISSQVVTSLYKVLDKMQEAYRISI